MKAAGLDKANGFELQVSTYANMSATRLALSGGTVQAIVSDWLWAGQRGAQGQALWFVPYSRSIGRVMVSSDSTLKWPEQLKGKRIGVAGGPFSKGWMLLQADAKKAGLDLKKEAVVKFAAPPLLSSELERGNLDVLVTFWRFGARLEAKGFKRLLDLDQVSQSLGLSSQMPMLGYVLDRQWALSHKAAAQGFERAVAETKELLAEEPDRWLPLKPLMKAKNTAEFNALKAGYLAGIAAPLDQAQIDSAISFYKLIDQSRTKPTGLPLNPSLFRLEP